MASESDQRENIVRFLAMAGTTLKRSEAESLIDAYAAAVRTEAVAEWREQARLGWDEAETVIRGAVEAFDAWTIAPPDKQDHVCDEHCEREIARAPQFLHLVAAIARLRALLEDSQEEGE